MVDAFTELYEMTDVVMADVGRYGFVMLKYYMSPHGFEEDALFDALWQEWFNMKLYLMAKS